MIKKCLIVVVLLFSFSINVCAEQTAYEDFYKEQYEISGAETLPYSLPDETRRILEEGGINPEMPDWVNSVTPKNVFSHILEFLKSGAKTPLFSAAALVSIILISAALESMGISTSSATAALYATALSATAVIIKPVFSTVNACIGAMQGCAVFMMSFVPIFAVIVASSGTIATSISMSSLLLGAAQVVNYISNFIVIPLLGGYMSISIAASISPIISNSGIAEGIKKLSFWIMSLATTVFIGILSIQTTVNASADTLSLKTAKFLIGSSVPIAGTALSEALTTVTASMGLLKSTVGIYGVIACCALFLPLLAELILWRVILVVVSSISDLFSLSKISKLLRSIDTLMSVMTGIILLSCALFVISLCVVITVG